MVDEILFTLTENGTQIVGKILGNESKKQLLICSHGFGVDSDSAGMFSVICEMFKNEFLTVRFHYVSTDQFTGDTYVHPFSKQLEKLRSVIKKLSYKYPDFTISIIGHSQGCFFPAMLLADNTDIKIKKVILIAPPSTTNLSKKMLNYFSKRSGSEINIDGMSILTRSLGNKTYVPSDFCKEADKFNPLPLYEKLNEKYEVHFITAINDSVLDPKEYRNLRDLGLKSIHDLPNDHNFQEDKMLGLLTYINTVLD